MKHYHTFLNSTCALALGALMTVGLSGCAATELVDEPGIVPSELGDVTVIATLGQGVGTRTGHEEVDPANPMQGVKVTWVPGDDIKIACRDDNDKFTPTLTTTFTFAGMDGNSTVTGIFKGKTELVSGSNKIVYPARVTLREDGFLLFDMTGQTQWGNSNMAHLGAYDVMERTVTVNDWSSSSISFLESSHLNALMTFNLTDIPADLGRPQSITLGCTNTDPVFSTNPRWYSDIKYVPTLELKLTGFATPAADTKVDIKAYMMMAKTIIPAGESLTITVKGDKGSYIFTSDPMVAEKKYEGAKRYTASASTWTKVYSDFTYTGAEAEEAFTGSGDSAGDAGPQLVPADIPN